MPGKSLLSSLKPVLSALGTSKAPIIVFGLGLLASIWLALTQLLWSEHASLRRSIAQDAGNLALVLDQNIARSVGDIDQMLHSLRQAYVRNGHAVDWPTMIENDYRLNEERVQIAILSAEGIMITSTSMLYPDRVIDLSEREHFRVHASRKTNELFISKPVLGRATGKWTIQFTRPLNRADGAFDGVIVVSLDPSHLARIYGGLKLGDGSGLAVIGSDGIVRAGTGIFGDWQGQGFREGIRTEATIADPTNGGLTVEKFGKVSHIVAARRLTPYPLEVVVAAPDADARIDWQTKHQTYLAGATVLSILVMMGMLTMLITGRRHHEQIVRMARHDSLTGLSNRVSFREKLQCCYAAVREGRNFALHVLDLDGFKGVNDTYGHPLGDKLLKAVAERLQANLRQSDFVARLGGDEFAILQGNLPNDDAAATLAARLCRILAEPYDIDEIKVTVGASIGIALGSKDGRAMSHLLKAADLALYAAKADGRGKYKFYREDMNAAAKARRDVEDGLREALKLNQLEVHYQPITSIGTGKITAYEALVRWRHPQRGLVPPLEFIPIAEETGLIIKLGEWVLRRACEDMAQRDSSIKVAVNFSPIQFRDVGLVQMVEDALSSSGLAPERLEIEITESTLMQRDNRTIAHLRALKLLGINIAMDDFGTGYSSLSYLQSYPINCIKIDRSFVKSLGENSGSAAIIKAITSLATSLNMSTTAEGVETREQLDALAVLGCNEAQGFYFSRPMPAADILPPIASGDKQLVLAA